MKKTFVWIRKYPYHLVFVWIVLMLYLLDPIEKNAYSWRRAKTYAYVIPLGLALAYGELLLSKWKLLDRWRGNRIDDDDV
jgi:hypothetical protein